MPDISKINALAIGSVAKVDGLAKASIANINDLTIPSAVSPLLDTYTGAVAAYSVRRLLSGYTGACMRVREDSTDTETDIGFDLNGDLDAAAIATHCGTANGYVTKWYGQESSGGSGSGADAVQPTNGNQPQIYNGTSVFTDNGKPIVRDPTSSSPYQGQFNVSIAFTGDFTTFQVSHEDNPEHITYAAGGTFWPYVGGGAGSPSNGTYTTVPSYWGNGSALLSQRSILFALMQSQSLLVSQGAATITVTRIGLTASTYRFPAMQELVVWASDQLSNRTGIESNINGYFSIYP